MIKTTHTEHSVGFIVESPSQFAYLGDGVVPPPETMARLTGLDFLVLEATLDELRLSEGIQWFNSSLQDALDIWRQTGVERCILTHLSDHSWEYDRLVAGLFPAERRALEQETPGLTFAYDGMRVKFSA